MFIHILLGLDQSDSINRLIQLTVIQLSGGCADTVMDLFAKICEPFTKPVRQ